MPGEHPFMAQMKDYFKLLVIDIFDEALNLQMQRCFLFQLDHKIRNWSWTTFSPILHFSTDPEGRKYNKITA